MAVGFGHFGCAFGFFLFGEEVCFGLGFDGFGALGFGEEGGFCFLGYAIVWTTSKYMQLVIVVGTYKMPLRPVSV